MKLSVRITPNASRVQIGGIDDNGMLRIRIQSPPVDGAANKRLIRFLAKQAGVSKSKVKIVSGETSRNKVIEIEGADRALFSLTKG